jgi:hypothetical protein
MTISDLLLQDFDFEISNTRRTLERLPEDRNGWKCHDKSMELGKLTMHCATLPLFGFYILADDGMDMAASKRAQVPLVFTTREAAQSDSWMKRQNPVAMRLQQPQMRLCWPRGDSVSQNN